MENNELQVETTACSGGDCVEVASIGSDWFRIRSTVNRQHNVAVTGDELRAFIAAAKAGQFDAIAGVAGGEKPRDDYREMRLRAQTIAGTATEHPAAREAARWIVEGDFSKIAGA